MNSLDNLQRRRRRIFEIVEIGSTGDWASRLYDLFYTLTILVNLTATILSTFDAIDAKYGTLLDVLDLLTVVCFTVDFALRLYTADFRFPGKTIPRAGMRYIFSFSGIIDILSFLPYYLPIFFPAGAVAFRMLRVIRIFRLFRINGYYDSLNVITSVLSSKRKQLISSVSIILVLMLASSLCMYSLENAAQPDVFKNAFSGIWWAASTLLTVGYGDIYPITSAGRILGIIITFLGVGMVAIPTGIISAGFVEQDTRLKRMTEQASEMDMHFIKVQLHRNDGWTGREIKELGLPGGVIVAAIQRDRRVVVPKGDVELKEGDVLVIGAEYFKDDWHIDLKEVVLRRQSPWNGVAIRDLDISRQTIIVMIRRRGTMLVPRGDFILREGDEVLLYTKSHITDAVNVEI
ncbi:MAG: ion transporter [Oscillospiraceae bacterium]|nr:ion transporter [Oscillospiraceae bacterium]